MSERGDPQASKGRAMLDNLKRIRQPVTWAVLAIICASIVLGVVRLVLLVYGETPVFDAFQAIGSSIMSLALVLAQVALVCACLFVQPATRNAVRLAKLSAWVIAIGTLIQLICLGLGLAAALNAFGVIMEVLGGLLDITLKAVAAGALWVLVRGVKSGRLDLAPAVPEIAVTPEQPKTPPVWNPEQASGTAWRSARDAASGARPDVGAASDEPAARASGPGTPGEHPDAVTEARPEPRWKPRAGSGGDTAG